MLKVSNQLVQIQDLCDSGENEQCGDNQIDNAPEDVSCSIFDVRCSAAARELKVRRWALSSSLLQPRFPATFEHEYVTNLRFLAQSFRHLPSQIATFRTAVNNNLFARRPSRQKLRQQ